MTDKKLKSLEEFNAEQRKKWRALPEGAVPNGIACPKCGHELVDPSPNLMLTSYPPQKHTKCLDCGYEGYRVA